MSVVIKELVQSYKALYSPPQENPLDLRITNIAIALLGSATFLLIAPSVLFNFNNLGIQFLSLPTKSALSFNINPMIVDLKEIVENNARYADFAIAATQAQTALIVLLAASCVLGALVAYRHYKHPEFYNN